MKKETIKFEGCLEKLEGLVKKLEHGELTLDESLKAFEEGVGLARQCSAMLEEAKGKVEELVQKESGELKVVPFKVEGESS